MVNVEVHIPAPWQYMPETTIDEIALAYNRAWRATSKTGGYPVDIDRFIDWLAVPVDWEKIDEPESAMLLANYRPVYEEHPEAIIINQNHQQFFEERPDVYATCLGHEVGHRTLRHCEHPEAQPKGNPLFDAAAPNPRLFHRSSWHQYGMSKEEVEERKQLMAELAKHAAIDNAARAMLAQIENHFEPKWMFWQAEHFSLCLLVPQDQLLALLEQAWDFQRWNAVYELAKMFRVSAGMMRRRLEKMKIIEVKGNKINHHPSTKQSRLF